MLTSLKNRLAVLESKQPQQEFKPLEERIREYEEILESGNFDSEKGRLLKYCLEKYGDVIAELEEE